MKTSKCIEEKSYGCNELVESSPLKNRACKKFSGVHLKEEGSALSINFVMYTCVVESTIPSNVQKRVVIKTKQVVENKSRG